MIFWKTTPKLEITSFDSYLVDALKVSIYLLLGALIIFHTKGHYEAISGINIDKQLE